MSNLSKRIRASGSVRLRRYRANLRTWWHQSLRSRPFLFTDQNNITLHIKPTDDLRSLFYFRTHFDDIGLLQVVSRILRPGMTVLDVGANHGQFALFAADRVAPGGRVHAFEPSSSAWSRFQRNLSSNPNLASHIVPVRTALSSEPGAAKLYGYSENSEWSSLYPHDKWASMEQRSARAPVIQPSSVENVSTTTLNRYCQEASVNRIDLLKIDVEGFEHAVLRGASEFLKNHLVRYVVYEICTDLLTSMGQQPEEIVDILKTFGYETWRIESNGDLQRCSCDDPFPFLANYVATPLKEHHAAS